MQIKMPIRFRAGKRLFKTRSTVFNALRLVMALAFLSVCAPVTAAAQMTPDDFNDLAPQAGMQDLKLNSLGLLIADYRVAPKEAATRLEKFMRDNPDNDVTRKYTASLTYGGYIGLDRHTALADAITEARKNLYVSPGMSTVYASNRVFDEIERALQNSSYKLFAVAAIGVLVALGVLFGMIGGGMRAISGGRRTPRGRVPANTDRAAPAKPRRAV